MVNPKIIQVFGYLGKFIGEYAFEKGLNIGNGLIWKAVKPLIKKDTLSIKLYTIVEKFVQKQVNSLDYDVTGPICEIISDSLYRHGLITGSAYQEICRNLQSYSLNISSLEIINSELNEIILQDEELRNYIWNSDFIHIMEGLESIKNVISADIKTGIQSDNTATDISQRKLSSLDNRVNLTDIPSPIDLIGRTALIKQIREFFNEYHIISIKADGGSGKTAIATKLINIVKEEIINKESSYKHVAWIISTGNLVNDFRLAINNDGAALSYLHDDYFTYFQSHPTFIVIDNMDIPPNSKEIRYLNSIAGKTKILITSRAEISGVKQVELSKLEEEQALIVFYKYYLHFGYGDIPNQDIIKKRYDNNYAINIIKSSFFNILLMELIAKAAYKEKLPLKKVWESIVEDPDNISSRASIDTEHAISHSFVCRSSKDREMKIQDQIRRLYRMPALNDEQQQIMNFITLFPTGICIYRIILEEAGFSIDNIFHLEELGWIKYNSCQYGYEVHPLIIRSLSLQRDKTEIKFDIKKYSKLIFFLANEPERIVGDFTIIVNNYLKICETICNAIMERNWLYYDAVNLFIQTGSYYGDSPLFGNYYYKSITAQKSIQLLKYALNILLFSNNEGKETEIANIVAKIVRILKIEDDKEGVITFIEEFPQITERIPKCASADICMAFNHIGNVLSYYKRYEEAITFYQFAINIGGDMYYKSIPCIAINYLHLASAYSDLGKNKMSVKCCKDAISICEKTLGKYHEYTASLYRILGLQYYIMGDDEKAEEYINKYNVGDRSDII